VSIGLFNSSFDSTTGWLLYLPGSLFDAVYGSRILPLLLYTLDKTEACYFLDAHNSKSIVQELIAR